MAVAKLTKRAVDALQAPETGELWLWDAEVKGFGVKVNPTGRKVFYAKFRAQGDPTTKKVSLGAYGPLTVDQARNQAIKTLGSVATGHDPARARADRRKAVTVADALNDYLRDHAGRWRPRTAAEYRRQATQLIIPRLGTRKIADVTRGDITELCRSLGPTPVLANRVLALVSALFTHAIRTGLRPDGINPAKHLPRHKERGRTRFLTGDEIGRLGVALKAAESGEWTDGEGNRLPAAPWQSVAAIRLLALTGCRKGEVLDLRWSEVDVPRTQLLLRDTKAGESTRPLAPAAIAILEALPKGKPTDRVLAGTKGRRHEVKYAWEEIRRIAGLQDVRLHDLRHTVASRSQHSGHSLLVTGALLGHRNLATTQKYAHLIAGPVNEAANRVTGEIGALLDGRETVVQPINGPRRARKG